MGMVIISIDIGTSGIRGAIFNNNLERLYIFSTPYTTKYVKLGWAEQDPNIIYLELIKVLKEVINKCKEFKWKISGIVFDSALHGIMGISKNMEPITPYLTWEDNRAISIIEKWKKDDFMQNIYFFTGCPLHPLYPLAKIYWLKENSLDIFKAVRFFVSIKSYLIYKITGEILEDYSIASGTGIFNIYKLDWDDSILKIIGISKDHLPHLVPPNFIISKISKDFSYLTGLPINIPVVVGGSDASFSSLGSGTIYPKEMTIMIGTSGAIRYISKTPILDNQKRTWCYYLSEDMWIVGGAVNNGGNILRWFKENFLEEDYEKLNEYAKDIPVGSDNLIFLPFLAGERSPHWNANIKGILVGLSFYHTKGHFIRAIMEGVSLNMLSVYNALCEILGEPEEIRITGGFTSSPLWIQILCDVIGKKLNLPLEREGSLIGGALFGLKSLGILESFDIIKEKNPIKEVFSPDLSRHYLYNEIYKKYIRIYEKLKDEF